MREPPVNSPVFKMRSMPKLQLHSTESNFSIFSNVQFTPLQTKQSSPRDLYTPPYQLRAAKARTSIERKEASAPIVHD